MIITTYRTLIFWITGVILAAAIGAVAYFGLPFGIDFTGGSLIQISYPNGRPALANISDQISALNLGEVSARESGTDAVVLRSRALTPAEHTTLIATLSKQASVRELSFTSVGPSFGSQFASKSLWALLAVTLAIAAYIAFAFRKVSRPIPSWVYGVTVIAMLVHDLIVPIGFYAVLAHFTGASVDALFVTALLALLGYSVNDTIVVFDRVREHLAQNEEKRVEEDFEKVVAKSISETLTRSLNTSLTTALALVALVFFGAEATRNFALVMLVGVVAGTYSSILVAAPLLVPFARWYTRPKA